jgi:hypothetical protein
MTDQSMPSVGASHELLAATRALTRRVRSAQRGAWFPLLLFGLATLGAPPFDHYGGHSRTCTPPNATGYVCSVYSRAEFVYWPIVFVLIYAAVGWFYTRRSRERGVGTRVRLYVVVGIIVAVVLTAASVWVITHPSPSRDVFGVHLFPGTPAGSAVFRVVSPAAAIGLALLVLSRIERSLALLVFAVGYLAIVLFSFPSAHYGPGVVPHLPVFPPRILVEGGVLLLGSAAFALAERRGRRSAP